MGTAFVPMSSTALFRVSPHDAGVASATLNTSQQIGGSLGTALLNTLAASATVTYLATRAHTPSNVVAAQVHGYSVGFLVGAGFLVVAALSALFLVERHEGRPGRRGRCVRRGRARLSHPPTPAACRRAARGRGGPGGRHHTGAGPAEPTGLPVPGQNPE